MRTLVFRSALASAFVLTAVLTDAAASAGLISTENAKAGSSGDWVALDDGTAAADGVVDVYPAKWSIAAGESLDLKIRSTTGYDVRIFRLGWYGGAGSTEVTTVTGKPADPQPYPFADATFGLTEAKWHVSTSIATAGWTPGVYAARIEQSGGKMADTIFVVRDDTLAAKLPVLFVLATNTHQAYNAWPGPSRGGKSLYAFNCSPATVTSDTIAPPIQATKVSFDRPFYVGGGTADISRAEYPFIRWLERQGTWDVAYATDLDLYTTPSIMTGRKVVVFVGHSEYWPRASFDAAIAARDSGVNMLFATGDTISWQVRFEAGAAGATSTMVGYKENYGKDPEWHGDPTTSPNATRPWKTLGKPGMVLSGVQSSGQIRDEKTPPQPKPDYAFRSDGTPLVGWADMVVTDSTFWLYAGTGMAAGDSIKNVMGYEVDSTLVGNPDFDPYRPPGQRRIASLKQVSDGTIKGASGFYRTTTATPAEVLGLGAIAFSWALDDYAEKSASSPPPPSSVDPHAQQMMTNVFNRWVGALPPPPPVPDGGILDVGPDPDAIPPTDTAIPDSTLAEVSFDSALLDAGPPDAAPTDTAVADTTIAEAAVADTTLGDGADATVADTTTTADTTTSADTGTANDSTTSDSGTSGDSSTTSDSNVADAAIDDADADTGAVDASGSGCGCAVPGHDAADSSAIGLAASALALIVARRRKRA